MWELISNDLRHNQRILDSESLVRLLKATLYAPRSDQRLLLPSQSVSCSLSPEFVNAVLKGNDCEVPDFHRKREIGKDSLQPTVVARSVLPVLQLLGGSCDLDLMRGGSLGEDVVESLLR